MATLTKQAKETLDVRLGADLRLPIDGSFEPVKGLDLLLQDIQQLLLTVPGEFVSRPTFGCMLKAQLWENIDEAANAGPAIITSALENFESRIDVIRVTSDINRNSDLITFNIFFTIKNTDVSVNLVFPYRTSSQLSAG